MTPTRIVSLLAALALGTLAAGCGGGSDVLVGAGSSLVEPLLSHWSTDYAKRGNVTVTYGPIGSGGGIAQITARTVDFGASDAPLTPDQAAAAKDVLQIPWALSATLLAYNVEGAPARLRLSGPVLAEIYLGAVRRWNDPAIAKLNPGASLPATRITPLFRSDGSGDTYALTSYLSKVSPAFAAKVGAGTEVRFPTGAGAKGNRGVGGVLSSTNGAVGYLAISYVFENGFDYALLRNAAGAYPDPRNPRAIAAAAEAAPTPRPDNTISLIDPPASATGAYPISTYTYALVPRRSAKAAALRRFLTYALSDGQRFARNLSFAPMPASVLAADRRTIAKIGS